MLTPKKGISSEVGDYMYLEMSPMRSVKKV